MSSEKKQAYLAFDYGASSGRLMLCTFDGEKLDMQEIHRFPNEPVWMAGHFYWDFPRLFHEMKQGLKKAARLQIPIDGIGIDTWGVDYGFLDKDGQLIANPFCYRDPKNETAMTELEKAHPFAEIYAISGLQRLDFNTAYQLYYDVKHRPYVVEAAETFLFVPDLFAYLLTGEKVCEYTIASTSALLDAKKRDWSGEIMDMVGIPRRLFPKLVQPGEVIGYLSDAIREETGMERVPVIAVGSHDTASAVCGAPIESENSIFMSSGTWSLIGMEIPEPIITEDSLAYNYTNEGGVEHTIRFLKNITGLWIIQNLKKKWNETDPSIGYPDIIAAAKSAERKDFMIDPDDPRFTAPMDMVKAVVSYCEEHGQGTPASIGEIAMAAYNGLGEKYRQNVEAIEKLTGRKTDVINMVGGGTQDKFLCQMTATRTGRKVLAGPIEAAVVGSVLMQMKALGQLSSLEEGRAIIKKSFPIEVFQ